MKHAIVDLSIALWLAAGMPAAAADKLVLFTEDYSPFNYRENGEYVGIGVSQVKRIMQDTGIDYTMEMVPWARAIGSAERRGMTCVFTTAHTVDREARFKWVEPLILVPTTLMKREGSSVDPKTIDEARALIIGTQRGDFTHEILVKNGFRKIELTSVINLSVQQLLGGRVDLVMVSKTYYDQLLREGKPVVSVLELEPLRYAIACNTSVPDTIIKAMQNALDAIIASGEQTRVLKQYELVGK